MKYAIAILLLLCPAIAKDLSLDDYTTIFTVNVSIPDACYMGVSTADRSYVVESIRRVGNFPCSMLRVGAVVRGAVNPKHGTITFVWQNGKKVKGDTYIIKTESVR